MQDFNIQKDIELTSLNSFGLHCVAKEFIEVTDEIQIPSIINAIDLESLFFLGGGSNIILPPRLERTVLHMSRGHIEVVLETEKKICLQVDAGLHWHDLVSYCVSEGYGGIEQLALIPGQVGAAPVQNIGAYGVELKDVCTEVRCYDVIQKSFVSLSPLDCKFAYRDSVFKQIKPLRYIIVSIQLELDKSKEYHSKVRYQALENYLTQEEKIPPFSMKDVYEAVIEIRQSKLPDPKVLGNCGSFFKNPIITKMLYDHLLGTHDAQIPAYPYNATHVKVPAAYLIDQLGWKEKRTGDVGNYEHQALVLVNYGNATQQQVIDHVAAIQESVQETYGIELETEVNIILN